MMSFGALTQCRMQQAAYQKSYSIASFACVSSDGGIVMVGGHCQSSPQYQSACQLLISVYTETSKQDTTVLDKVATLRTRMCWPGSSASPRSSPSTTGSRITGRKLGWLMICDPPEQSPAEIAAAIGSQPRFLDYQHSAPSIA